MSYGRALQRGNDNSSTPSVFSDSHTTFVTIDSRDTQSSANPQTSNPVFRLDDFFQRFLAPVTFGDTTGSRVEMALFSFIIPYTAATYGLPHYIYTDQVSTSAIGSEFRQLLAIIPSPELMGAPASFPGMIYGKVPEPLSFHKALPTDQLDLLQVNVTAGLYGISGYGTDWPAMTIPPSSSTIYASYTFVFRKVA